ncbi:MoaD/ThiS family protein [Gimesia aquarii]|uniref:Molybdopterin synthase sulfur carrier subunit n=1 Tax=Gimesia aquarii TaxID=2527964 RepID=A0A517VQL3_9PLAN|nr:MoaD/ThiS family protein [Gimesia aquarii]QDT95314.1 molybdopterin synthase small subunit [Gimesia aquarii]
MTVQQIHVKLFARAKELVNSELISVTISEGMTVEELRLAIAKQYPELQSLSNQLLIAIDNAYAGEGQILNPEQEVACFPPVSGG